MKHADFIAEAKHLAEVLIVMANGYDGVDIDPVMDVIFDLSELKRKFVDVLIPGPSKPIVASDWGVRPQPCHLPITVSEREIPIAGYVKVESK